MRVKSRVAVVVALIAAAVAVQHAQQQRPQFRAGVEFVQVDVRVVDDRGEPIRGLTQADFTVTEDGAPQNISAFSVVDLPLAPQTPQAPFAQTLGVRPDVATNVRPAERGRTFLIVFEADFVAPCQTIVVRKALRQFIERSVGPDDLVAINSSGLDRSFQNFTNDKARLLAVVDSLIGQAEPGPTVAAAQDISARADHVDPSRDPVANPAIGDATMDPARQAFRRLIQFVQAMASAGEGSKAIILVTESMPFNMALDPTAGMSAQGLSLITEMERVATAARRGNVPIYPIYPRGLTDGHDCESDGGVFPVDALLGEVRQQQVNIRALADDSGGVPILGNDLAGGLDRVARLTSSYYVLGYNSSNNRGEGRYHKINVRVNRRDARVVARKGYLIPKAATPAALAALAGPPGSSVELREALNAVLPVSDLPMSVTAAAFRQPNGMGASAAVVVEALGADFEWTAGGALSAPIELTAVAMQRRGEFRTGEQAKLTVTQPADAATRIRSLGLRWIARLDDLKPGRYQIRGAVSNGPRKQGSAWYDIEIPDFSKAPLAMSDVVVASVVAAQRLTMRPDKTLAAVLPAPATAMRQFPAIDTLALYAEVYDNDPQVVREIETSVVVISDRGEEKRREMKTLMADNNGVARIQTRLPLAGLTPGRYTIAVEARQTANRAVATGRALPFQIVEVGKK